MGAIKLVRIFWRGDQQQIMITPENQNISGIIEEFSRGFFGRKFTVPVSYTHLDVYKRQVMRYVSFSLSQSLRLVSPLSDIVQIIDKIQNKNKKKQL